MTSPRPIPLLIALPCGLSAGGVTTWAARLCNARASAGLPSGLILHRPRCGDAPIDLPLHPAVRRFDLGRLPPLDEANGDTGPWLASYRAAADAMSSDGSPVVCAPSLMGDCASLFARLLRERPRDLRILGWCHLDSDYDRRVLEFHRDALSAAVAVSDAIEPGLRALLPGVPVWNIPYGVEVPALPPRRPPLGVRPLRIIYPGRLDEGVKRVSALVHMSAALDAAGVEHALTIVGDGPARAEIERAISDEGPVTLLPPAPPRLVRDLLAAHDLFVLPSRAEGLSVAMLEAMSAGCVPVVSRVRSGAGQAVEHMGNGVLVDVPPDAGAEQAGLALAGAIALLRPGRIADLSRAAWQAARDRFGIESHSRAVERLLESVADAPPRSWPAGRPDAFTGRGQGSGTVPADAGARLDAMLSALAGRRVLIHGTGRHTRELAHVLRRYLDRVVAFTDDDPARCGVELLGLPVIAPADAPGVRATDAVVSSWLHQDAVLVGRAVYERAGIAVHSLYPRGGGSGSLTHAA